MADSRYRREICKGLTCGYRVLSVTQQPGDTDKSFDKTRLLCRLGRVYAASISWMVPVGVFEGSDSVFGYACNRRGVVAEAVGRVRGCLFGVVEDVRFAVSLEVVLPVDGVHGERGG